MVNVVQSQMKAHDRVSPVRLAIEAFRTVSTFPVIGRPTNADGDQRFMNYLDVYANE